MESIKNEVTPRRIRVFPNLVRMDHYEQVDLQEDPFTVKILWQGGIAHYEDWYPLKDALGHISAKYPEVHWVIWGAQFPWVKELIPAHRYTFKNWQPYHEFKLRLCMIGHDISLAPLSPNVFNNCRSAIKFYESSVLKKPAATLAQRTGPYRDEIRDGETGLLFSDPDEFVVKLSNLIEDAKFRKTLAANAKDWVSENREAMKKVPEMVGYWEQLREERKREQPRVSDERWDQIQKEAEEEQKALEAQPA
jgi:glycosyltransferase involved in cell wall biosynthesis